MAESTTALEKILVRLVNESDPIERSRLADQYGEYLKATLRAMASRAHTTLWSEKEDILQQIGDTNTLVSHLLDALSSHDDESKAYRQRQEYVRQETINHLETMHAKIDAYIAQIPADERLRLVGMIEDHERRISELENNG